MFVYLSKLLPLFIYPLGLGCILLIIVLASEKHKKLRRGLLISALVILWLGSNRWVSFGLARSLEWRNLPPETLRRRQRSSSSWAAAPNRRITPGK